jgi:hypothetical protein
MRPWAIRRDFDCGRPEATTSGSRPYATIAHRIEALRVGLDGG